VSEMGEKGLWICANGCMYGHETTTEITQNTFGAECMAIALTFSRVCSFEVTQKALSRLWLCGRI